MGQTTYGVNSFRIASSDEELVVFFIVSPDEPFRLIDIEFFANDGREGWRIKTEFNDKVYNR